MRRLQVNVALDRAACDVKERRSQDIRW